MRIALSKAFTGPLPSPEPLTFFPPITNITSALESVLPSSPVFSIFILKLFVAKNSVN